MTKRKMKDIILYNGAGEAISATIYQEVIDTSSFGGKNERFGMIEVIDANGRRINVSGEGDDRKFEYSSGEKLYLHPPEDEDA